MERSVLFFFSPRPRYSLSPRCTLESLRKLKIVAQSVSDQLICFSFRSSERLVFTWIMKFSISCIRVQFLSLDSILLPIAGPVF